MTNQQRPGNIVNSITFFNPPYNSRQTTATDLHQRQQHLQQTAVTSQQHVSSPENVPHHSEQAHPTSTVQPQQLSFQLRYSTASSQNPQLTTNRTVSSLTPNSTDVKCANIVSSPSSSSTSSFSTSSGGTAAIDEKRVQKLERNRIAAKECRERKKAYVLNLENKTNKLEDENLILRQKVQELKTKLEWIESKHQENIRLKNLVKELKEKIMKMEWNNRIKHGLNGGQV